jgi:peptidylamidoglycolate lyase
LKRRSRSAPLALALVVAAAADPVGAQQARVPICTEVEGWAPRLAPEDTLGLVAGVAIDAQGRVVAFRRAGRPFSPAGETPIDRPAVLVLDPSDGTVLASWGADRFLVPHSISFDGRGNAWVADTGLHQVMGFAPDGRLLLEVGEARVPGDDEGHFNQPSGVTVASDGTFYVSDGYRNTRVMHFSSEGRLLAQWGAPGTGRGQFDLPHGIVLGRDGLIHVADRENSRIQSFDASGRVVRVWDDAELGRPFAILETDPDSRWGGLWLVSSRSVPVDGRAWSRVNVVDGSGRVIGSFGRRDGGSNVPLLGHGMAVGPDGEVYLAGSVGLVKFDCR